MFARVLLTRPVSNGPWTTGGDGVVGPCRLSSLEECRDFDLSDEMGYLDKKREKKYCTVKRESRGRHGGGSIEGAPGGSRFVVGTKRAGIA